MLHSIKNAVEPAQKTEQETLYVTLRTEMPGRIKAILGEGHDEAEISSKEIIDCVVNELFLKGTAEISQEDLTKQVMSAKRDLIAFNAVGGEKR